MSVDRHIEEDDSSDDSSMEELEHELEVDDVPEYYPYDRDYDDDRR